MRKKNRFQDQSSLSSLGEATLNGFDIHSVTMTISACVSSLFENPRKFVPSNVPPEKKTFSSLNLESLVTYVPADFRVPASTRTSSKAQSIRMGTVPKKSRSLFYSFAVALAIYGAVVFLGQQLRQPVRGVPVFSTPVPLVMPVKTAKRAPAVMHRHLYKKYLKQKTLKRSRKK